MSLIIRRFLFSATLSLLLSLTLFNLFARDIDDFLGKLRHFVVTGSWETLTFDSNGIPTLSRPRIGRYTSPFYVVHFALLHSEACRGLADTNRFHWRRDESLRYWPRLPSKPDLKTFRSLLDWLISHATTNDTGLTHFLYTFDWPYEAYPGTLVKAPWWSGLTDGYAIVVLLRGYDCFKDERYLKLASELYKSLTTPVTDGGSLLVWEGQHWVEEYVDSRVEPSRLSRVLNGMIYAYMGLRAYEEFTSTNGLSEKLLRSVGYHIRHFDLGYWSYYDAIGTRANMKYHAINWALLQNPEFHDIIPEDIKTRWRLGVQCPALYLIYGPRSTAYFHAWATFLVIWGTIFILLTRVTHVCKPCAHHEK
jgi:hypothetical protein